MDIDDARVAFFLFLIFFLFRCRFFFLLLSRFFFLLLFRLFFRFLFRFFFLFLSGFFFSVILERRDLIFRDVLISACICRILNGALLSKKILELCRDNISDPGLVLVDGDDLFLAEQLEQVLREGDLVSSVSGVIISDRVLVRDHISQYRQVTAFAGKAGVRL